MKWKKSKQQVGFLIADLKSFRLLFFIASFLFVYLMQFLTIDKGVIRFRNCG